MTDQNIVAVNQIVHRVEVTTPGPAGRDGSGGTVTNVSGTAPISVANGTSTPAISLDNTAVTPGSYTSASITVDAKGRLTAASSGAAGGVTSLTGGSLINVDQATGAVTASHAPKGASGVATAYPGSITIDSFGHVIASGSTSTPNVAANNLNDVADKPAALTNLGGTTVGKAVFSAADAAAARTAIGAGTGSGDLLASNNLSEVTDSTARTNLGLGNVENTAISTFSGTSNITTVGTISTGVWGGTAIAYADVSGTPTLGTAAPLAVGISNTNVLQADANVADDDFLRVAGTKVEGRTAAEVLSDIGASPEAGNTSLTTTGTIATGTWNATAIEDTKLDLRVDHGVTFDGQGSVIESAKTVLVPVERAGVIKAATLVGDASGAITITITKYDPAADATTLGSAAAVGTIALATKIINRDTTLSGWTLAVAEGDILAFTTGGTIATVTRVTCKLKLELA